MGKRGYNKSPYGSSNCAFGKMDHERIDLHDLFGKWTIFPPAWPNILHQLVLFILWKHSVFIDLSYYSGLSNNTMFSLQNFEAQYIVLFSSVYIGITRLDDNFVWTSIHLLNENWQGNQLPSDEMEIRFWLLIQITSSKIFQSFPPQKIRSHSLPPLLSQKSNKTHLATNSFFSPNPPFKIQKKQSLTAKAPPKMLGLEDDDEPSAFPIGWNG